MDSLPLIHQTLAWSLAAVILAWLPPPRSRPWLVAGCGMALLGNLSVLSLALLLSASIVTWGLRSRIPSSPRLLVGLITVIIAGYLGIMTGGGRIFSDPARAVLVPVGMAYYCLRLVHYLMETYKGNLRQHALPEYLCYHFFPSTLPVGPIHRFDEFLRDWRRRRFDTDQVSGGLERILYGLVKIMVLGNVLVGQKLALVLEPVLSGNGMMATYASVIFFWLKLYLLFSGYSDVAIGAGRLAGLRFRENFQWPFLATNISEFWQRWHMSLSSWCRDYVFTPTLSISRNPPMAILVSMLVLGLWHEPSLHYLLWGAYHGSGIALYRWLEGRPVWQAWRERPRWRPLQKFAGLVLTLHFVLFSFPVTSALERWILE